MYQDNPYTAPGSTEDPLPDERRLWFEKVSLLLSVSSLTSLIVVVVAPLPGVAVAIGVAVGVFLAIPGLITGLIAVVIYRSRAARTSVLISGFVCLYNPTIFLSLTIFLRK